MIRCPVVSIVIFLMALAPAWSDEAVSGREAADAKHPVASVREARRSKGYRERLRNYERDP